MLLSSVLISREGGRLRTASYVVWGLLIHYWVVGIFLSYNPMQGESW